MTDNSSSSSNDHKTKVHLAIIGALQASAAALIAAGAQYFITVAPMKDELQKMKQINVQQAATISQPATTSQPSVPVQPPAEINIKKTLPPGDEWGFQQNVYFGMPLQVASEEDFKKLIEPWNKQCLERGTSTLVDLNFKIVLRSESAVRGEREGIHLGVSCLAEYKFMWIYGAYMHVDAEKGRHLWDDLVDGMKARYGEDLY